MSIRERQLNSVAYSSGNVTLVDIPRDAVYHWFSLACYGGTFSTVQGAAGTGPFLVPGFPFTLIKSLRLLRNGSDVVFQGSGEQLALEHYYLNKACPMATLYTTYANVETLVTATVRGITVPANSEGIGPMGGGFKGPDAANSTGVLSFDFQM